MVIFIKIFLLSSIIVCQSIDVTVDKNKIYFGESIQFKITIKNGNDFEVNLSNLDDFQILSGPNSSSQMSWVNGKMSSENSKSWTLLPTKKGKLYIPSLKINLGSNKNYQSKRIQITVLDQNQGKNNPNTKKEYFIEASLNNSQPYRGEQIVLTYYLYTKVNLSSFDFLNMPSYRDFWSEDLYNPRNLQFNEKKINSETWYVSKVKEVALFPTKSGDLKIKPATITIGVKTNNNRRNFDFFTSDFFGRSKQVTLATNELNLKVKSLPKTVGKPSAAIGQWIIQSKIDDENIKQDEAFTYSILIKGKGNIKTVEPSEFTFSDNLEIFDPEINILDKKYGNTIGGEKKINYVIIPRDYGEIELPQVELKFFDTKNYQWKTVFVEKRKIIVDKNEKSNESSIGLSKQEVLLIGKDIRYINLNDPKWSISNKPLLETKVYIILILTMIFYLLQIFILNNSEYFKETQLKRNSKNALKNSIKSLNLIAKDKNNNKYTEIHKILNSYISLKLNISIERSSDEIFSVFNENSSNKIILDEFKEILKKIDAARFSNVKSDDYYEDINLVQELLKKMDSQW